ncbi:MAG: hypothetical protein ACJAYV_001644 [Oleispira sp.]|jgi:hypothetical protein
MLRLSLLVLVAALAFIASAQAQDAYSSNEPVIGSALKPTALAIDEFTELEYQLIETTGLLSLSQQIKYSAQRLIAGSLERPEAAAIASESITKDVVINHAQHFAIAKQLAKRWTEEQWRQRLLNLIHGVPVATQKLIQTQLAHPMVQAAQNKERSAIRVQNDPEYRLYMNKLRQSPPAVSRWTLVENLDKQSGFSEIIIQTRSAVIKEIQQQVKGWQPKEMWQNQARQDVLEFLFYAYRKTPNSELKYIADSFNKPELNRFYESVLNTIN